MYRLEELRERRGWSQRQLAENSGVPQTSISRWERDGRGMPVDKAFYLAQALGCKMQDLLPDSNEEPAVLSNNELELLENFAAMTEERQSVFMQLSRYLSDLN